MGVLMDNNKEQRYGKKQSIRLSFRLQYGKEKELMKRVLSTRLTLFNGGNGTPFVSFSIFGVLIIAIWAVIVGCSNNDNKKMRQEETPIVSNPTSSYEMPYIPQLIPAPSNLKVENAEPSIEEKTIAHSTTSQPTKISRYYEEGYEAGYDDGEDDAVSDNGWGGQFDDSCRYKGKARKDYQLGYEEGYEAKYYDNKDSDE